MAQLEEAAAADAAEVVTTGTESGEVDTQEPDASSYYPDDPPPEPDEAEPEGEAEEGEEGEPEDDDEEDGEPEEAIAAPVSLKAEHKEQFAQLPPEAQRMVSEIVGTRDREVQQGLESARSAQREAERTAADQVAQTQRDFADRFERFAQAFAPQQPERQDYPNDTAFLVAEANWRREMTQFGQLRSQIDGIKGEADGHSQAREQEWRQEQIKQLMSVPEFADEASRVEFISGVENFGVNELGYSKEELSQAAAKDIIGLKKAMVWKADAEKWRAHVAKRNERPRQAGKFAKPAPAGGRTAPKQSIDPLKSLYPND